MAEADQRKRAGCSADVSDKDYTAPTYMDKIQDPVGLEYGDEDLTVKNVFETEKMQSTLDTMRKYYEAGYINKDAATASDDKSVKRFVTKGDGQPYAELIWSKDLGYEVVATPIMDTQVTNASARGALTAINKNSEHPEKSNGIFKSCKYRSVFKKPVKLWNRRRSLGESRCTAGRAGCSRRKAIYL